MQRNSRRLLGPMLPRTLVDHAMPRQPISIQTKPNNYAQVCTILKEETTHMDRRREKRKRKTKKHVVSCSNGINSRVQRKHLRRQSPSFLVPFAERTSTSIRGATDRNVALRNEWAILKRSSQNAVFVCKHHSRGEFRGPMRSLLTDDSANVSTSSWNPRKRYTHT